MEGDAARMGWRDAEGECIPDGAGGVGPSRARETRQLTTHSAEGVCPGQKTQPLPRVGKCSVCFRKSPKGQCG